MKPEKQKTQTIDGVPVAEIVAAVRAHAGGWAGVDETGCLDKWRGWTADERSAALKAAGIVTQSGPR